MSHDIIRQSQRQNATSLSTAADNLWNSPQNNLAVAPNSGNEVQPLQMIHRSLRGRYKLAILLAAIGATVGTMLGWSANERIYRARGLIKINPMSSYVTGPEKVRPMTDASCSTRFSRRGSASTRAASNECRVSGTAADARSFR